MKTFTKIHLVFGLFTILLIQSYSYGLIKNEPKSTTLNFKNKREVPIYSKFQVLEFKNQFIHTVSSEYFVKISKRNQMVFGCNYSSLINLNPQAYSRKNNDFLSYTVGLCFRSFNVRLIKELNRNQMDYIKVAVLFKF